MAVELSLPEAQSSLTAAAERFVAEAEYIISLRRHELADEAYVQAIADYVLVCGAYVRASDRLLDAIARYTDPLPPEYAARLPEIRAGRFAAFMNIQELAPDQASYWTIENQARISETDRRLTPEYREQVLADVNEAYVALRADPIASVVFDAERASFDGTLMDGLGDDPYPL